MPMGLRFFIERRRYERADMPVAQRTDLAHLDHRAFLDVEVDLHRGRRNGFDVGLDGGELVAVLGQQLLDDRFGLLDLGGIVLALHGKPDLFLLEAVKDVGDGDAVQALVIDLADVGFLA